MATPSQQKAFIERIAPLVQAMAFNYGVCVPSAVIAQACHETGYGVGKGADVKVAHHNFFGIKYKPNRVDCNSGYFIDGSMEEYAKGTFTPISTNWLAFSDDFAGVQGYFEFLFLHTHHYDSCKLITNPYAYLHEIKRLGYATGFNYAENTYAVIKAHPELLEYDKRPAFTEEFTHNDEQPSITRKFGKNTTSAPNRKLEYIVIHYTAGTNSRGGVAKNVTDYWDKNGRASADFVVDDSLIVQYNPDIRSKYTWHCGGNKYSTKGGALYGKCTNKNSIGIEICSTNSTGKADKKPNDPSWSFSQKALDNAVELVKYLMKEYGIPADRVIRHYDVNGKPCPGIVGWNLETNENEWIKFKKRL